MKVEWTDEAPRKIQQFAGADYPRENPDLEDVLTSADVDHIAEIFQTPLSAPITGTTRFRTIASRNSTIWASS